MRDKGQIFIEAGPVFDEKIWYDLSVVIAFLSGMDSYAYTYEVPPPARNHLVNHDEQISKLAKVFTSNYDEIEIFFNKAVFLQNQKALDNFQKNISEKAQGRG